jgi:hypothetical protein
MFGANGYIAVRIAEFLKSDSKLAWLKPTVEEHRFLPLYVGWDAALGIVADGTFVRWNHDSVPHFELLTTPFLQRLAICQGAKLYPELRVLLPDKPDNGHTCPTCHGTGTISADAQAICECGGAGWLVPGEPRGTPTG